MLCIPMIRKLRFEGRLQPEGKCDWRLEGVLGATVVQDCVATLAPVTTRIEETIVRRYLSDSSPLPTGDEIQMPDDETAEDLPVDLDLWEVLMEALALALPPYPHKPGLALVDETFTPPGKPPMDNDDTKPFAGLAALRDKFESGT